MAVDNFKFGSCLLFLAFDSVLYVLMTFYLDKAWPSRYGQREHPLFCLSPHWWCPNRRVDLDDAFEAEFELHRQRSHSRMERYEEDGNGEDALIRIRGLKKHFTGLFGGGTTVRAVNGVSLDMYQGQVFCLLGHNGAGKTTTIGMLTGKWTPCLLVVDWWFIDYSCLCGVHVVLI